MDIRKFTEQGGKAVDFIISNPQIVKEYTDLFIKNKELNLQLDIISKTSEVKLKYIAEKYETHRLLIERVFGKRAFALREYYEVLHKGLESDDTTLILSSLKAISDTIIQNPLEQLAAYTQAIESEGEILKLDF